MLTFIYRYRGLPHLGTVTKVPFVIGRDVGESPVDLDLSPDGGVSPEHARIGLEGGEYWIERLPGAGEIMINGQPLDATARRTLMTDDVVALGETIITLLPLVEAKPTPVGRSAASDPLEHAAQVQDATQPAYGPAAAFQPTASERLSLFYELLLKLGRMGGAQEILQYVVEQSVAVIPGAERGAAVIEDKAFNGRLVTKAFTPADSSSVSTRLAQLAMDRKKAFIMAGGRTYLHHDFGGRFDEEVVIGDPSSSMMRYRIRSAMYAPLVWDGKALGALCVDSSVSEDAFGPEDLNLLRAITHHTALALANISLRAELSKKVATLENVLKLAPRQIREALSEQRTRLRLGGEFKYVTILVSDLRGFTGLSASMNPAEVIDMLEEYFAHIVPPINKHGMVDKFIGDGILAVFGSPGPDEEQQLHAVRAALEMQAAMREVNERRASLGKPIAELGIGVDHGEVIHGYIGSPDELTYTVIGDAVNRASRFCDAAEGGTVLISNEVFGHIQRQLDEWEPAEFEDKHKVRYRSYRVASLKE